MIKRKLQQVVTTIRYKTAFDIIPISTFNYFYNIYQKNIFNFKKYSIIILLFLF